MARVCVVALLMSLAVLGTWAEERCDYLTLSSNNSKYYRQTVSGALQVTSMSVTEKISRSECVQGTSFGSVGPDVWVHYGCRAVFRVCFEIGYTKVVTCESKDHRQAYCGAGGAIRLLTIRKQLSKTNCVQGVNYFIDGFNIRVIDGCRAQFLVGL